MSLENLNFAFKELELHPSIIKRMKGKTSDNLIRAAEHYLKIKFPFSYRKFLSKFGYIIFEGQEIYGIVSEDFENSGIPDAIWLSYEDQKQFGWPEYFIHIYDVGEGTAYCLDTSQMNESNECPVVAWPIGGYEETPVLDIVAEDFGSFFLEQVKEQIRRKKEKGSSD